MLTSKQDSSNSIFQMVQDRIEAALKARTTKDEVTYVSVEELDGFEIGKLEQMYKEQGWTVEYQECAGEYEDLWFS